MYFSALTGLESGPRCHLVAVILNQRGQCIVHQVAWLCQRSQCLVFSILHQHQLHDCSACWTETFTRLHCICCLLWKETTCTIEIKSLSVAFSSGYCMRDERWIFFCNLALTLFKIHKYNFLVCTNSSLVNFTKFPKTKWLKYNCKSEIGDNKYIYIYIYHRK